MITLFFSKKNHLIDHFIQRLDQMVIPYQSKIVEDQSEIRLQDGEQIFVGESAIHQYLNQLEKDVSQWRACTCDDWFL